MFECCDDMKSFYSSVTPEQYEDNTGVVLDFRRDEIILCYGELDENFNNSKQGYGEYKIRFCPFCGKKY